MKNRQVLTEMICHIFPGKFFFLCGIQFFTKGHLMSTSQRFQMNASK